MPNKKKFAIVGTGSRGIMFRTALLDTYAETCELTCVCDQNPLRMKAWLEEVDCNVPSYSPEQFEAMIRIHSIDTVIVTTIDRTHHEYIIRAMEAGCDVICEKPMTTDPGRCCKILATAERTGKRLTVTFNYRYAPRNCKMKEFLQSGIPGRVHSVHFEWLLDTKHGADYFRRWHRDKRNSGGLMVHKSTHHFDLINWWLETTPKTVFAMGDLTYYGKENAEARGVSEFYQRAHGSSIAAKDPFALHLKDNDWLKKMYLDAESADGYQRDQSVFGDGISIEDDVSVVVRYKNKAMMSYHLTAYSPWEGYRICFNCSNGRIEFNVVEKPYVSAEEGDHNFAKNVKGAAAKKVTEPCTILWRPHWDKPRDIDVPAATEGGHGGADARMLEDIFAPKGNDPLERAAGSSDGAYSILTGIAANRSMATGRPVDVASIMPKQLRWKYTAS